MRKKATVRDPRPMYLGPLGGWCAHALWRPSGCDPLWPRENPYRDVLRPHVVAVRLCPESVSVEIQPVHTMRRIRVHRPSLVFQSEAL